MSQNAQQGTHFKGQYLKVPCLIFIHRLHDSPCMIGIVSSADPSSLASISVLPRICDHLYGILFT